ncbi:2OG-Fe(II) oxygenase [Flavitalea flava]
MKNNNHANFSVEGGTLVANFTLSLPSRRFKKANYLVLPNFLSPKELEALFAFTLQKEKELLPSKVYKTGTGNGQIDRSFRRSKVLTAPAEFRTLFTNKILKKLPLILEKLTIKEFAVDHIDAQITATNDGEFFKSHTDNGSPLQKRRQISYVFYYYSEPKPYTGGELRLYEPVKAMKKTDSQKTGAVESQPEKTFKTIVPVQNSIVFFDSGTLHEVAKVKCLSREFRDSRFTLNGWIYK